MSAAAPKAAPFATCEWCGTEGKAYSFTIDDELHYFCLGCYRQIFLLGIKPNTDMAMLLAIQALQPYPYFFKPIQGGCNAHSSGV